MSNELSTKVTTGLVLFSYCRLFKAHARPGGEPKYSMTIIIPKDDKKTVRDIKRAIANAIELGKEKWKGKAPRNVKTTFYDGDEEKPGEELYENCYYVSCSSKTKPGLVDKNLDEILDEEDLYSGCSGRVALNFYPYDVDGSRGISAGLNNVQVLKKGERLGGGKSNPEDDFGNDFELDDDDYKPKKKPAKRRDDDDDEDEAPRRRKTSRYADDDDQDESPRRKKSSSRFDDEDDEDDEDEALRRKKRPVDDDDDDEDEAPRRRKTTASGSAKKRSRSLIDDDDY
jgi:hypothetical protein